MDAATKRDRVVRLAQVEGLKAASLSGMASSAAVYAANKFSPWFRRSTNVSAKVALAVSPFFLAFYLRTELVLHGASVNPRAYGIKVDGEAQAEDGVPRRRRHGLNVFKRTANYLYKNPVHMVVGMGIPTVGGILWSTRNEHHLKLSQKLMHTRVYGQMSVLGMIVIIMAFRESMKTNGGLFIEEAEEDDEGEGATVPVGAK